jgi:hypothetical protein
MAYAIMVPLMIAAHTAFARAEIHIEGSASNVHVNARDTKVANVLAALAEHFGLRVLGTVGDRRISADFDGSLRQVIKRVLDGYNYVIGPRGHRIEVRVLGTASSEAVPPPLYPVPTYPAVKLRRDE